MVKAIIFDFWGTLVENGVWSPIKQVKEILGIRLPFSDYVVRMERAMMTKKFQTLKEAFESLCTEFDIKCDEHTLEALVGMWNKSWMLAKPYPEVKEVLQDLKGRYKLILISNTDCFSVNNVLDKFKMRDLFDGIFLSCNLSLIKTDQEFFRQVLKEIECQAEECTLVGDSIQSDMLAAQQAGMEAILIDRKNSRDFNPKINNFKELSKALESYEDG